MKYVGAIDSYGIPFIAVETGGNSIYLKISFQDTWNSTSFAIGLDIVQAKEIIRHPKSACETYAAIADADGRER